MTQPITGYRELTPDEVALINEIKAAGEPLRALIERVRAAPFAIDQRWVAIGQTHLQEGLMALTRGIAQPTTF